MLIGAAVLAVGAAGTFGVAGSADGVPAAVALVAEDGTAAAEAAQLATEERASRSEQRARLHTAQKRATERLAELRAHEVRLARERRAKAAKEMCARAEGMLDDLDLDAAQQRNLRIIVDLARRMDLPPRAAVVAVAAAWQESHLRNLDYGLADSVGMFQQRPSMGWGSNTRLQNPTFSTRKFYERLSEIRGWERMPIGVAAQAVQASAYPNAYARWATAAADGVRAVELLRRGKSHC